jgi:hypothetical protein
VWRRAVSSIQWVFTFRKTILPSRGMLSIYPMIDSEEEMRKALYSFSVNTL